MEVKNLRAMFAAAADIYVKAREGEIVEYHNTEIQLEALKEMRELMKLGHQQAIAMTQSEEYYKNWQRITPQGKSYDALPE